MSLIFVDCEASGPCPGRGLLTEFGAVDYDTRATFHGVLAESKPNPENPTGSVVIGRRFDPEPVFLAFGEWIKLHVTDGRAIMVSDNPAFDAMWLTHGFWHAIGRNPFGHSARRIGDFYAGLTGDFRNASRWKRLRITKHDHHPVNDAMGNVEAFERMLRGERAR